MSPSDPSGPGRPVWRMLPGVDTSDRRRRFEQAVAEGDGAAAARLGEELLVAERRAIPPAPTRLRAGFVVCGTGRCGTGYVTTVLATTGLAVGHEEHWTVERGRRRRDLDGDVSWLALPDLADQHGPVVQLVRDPVATVRSMVGIGMFCDPVNGPFRWFAFANQPGLVGDDVEDAVTWWVDWNVRIERHARHRVRLEDLTAGTGWTRLLAALGHPDRVVDRDVLEGPVNARQRARDLTLERLRRTRRWPDLVELAARYGYEVR